MEGKLFHPRGRAARALHDFFFLENLRNPARNRRAGLMRQFRSGQLYSILNFSHTCVYSRFRMTPTRNG